MKIFLSLVLTLFISTSFAQDKGFRSEGREFYLGYLHPSFNNFFVPETQQHFKVYALISSFEDNEVSVSYFDLLTKKEYYPTIYKIKGRQTTQILLDHEHMRLKDPGDIAGEFKSCHIVASRPVSVQFFSTGANSGGSYLALPVHAWGRQYVVASYSDNGGFGVHTVDDRPAGTFTIVAAYDGTEVSITPTTLTGNNHVGVNQGPGSDGTPKPYIVGMNRGQCWMVKSGLAKTGNSNTDISSSIVKSNKPIAVISGHEDGSPGDGNAKGTSLDSRDFMIEQMVPVEFWDNKGYITIPFEDSPGALEGAGENHRLYVSDEFVPSQITANRGDVDETFAPGTYQVPPGELNNTVFPTHFSSDSGSRFSAIQYELRSHGAGPPYPAPSMMTVVPRSAWRTSYQWYVPTNIDENLQTYYLTLIYVKDGIAVNGIKRNWYHDSIVVSTNGGSLGLITKLGAPKLTWSTIPDHPDLKATTYRLSPGTSYYIRSAVPILAYVFGNRSIDPEGTLGDSLDEHYFSYASPLGMSLSDNSVQEKLTITVDTLCNGWRICATDSNTDGGIRYVTLIDDADRDIWRDSDRAFSNCSILPPDDNYRNGEFHLGNMPRSKCFDVGINNPARVAVAPIAIYDKAGNYKIIQLTRPAVDISLKPEPDSVTMYSAPIGAQVCKDFVFVNLPSNKQSYMITKIELPPPSNFIVYPTGVTLPFAVKPGDTLRFTACFTGFDTMLYRDTIVLESDCIGMRIPLVGKAGTALILAADVDFGTVLIGTKRCKDVEVKNVGNVPLTLTNEWAIAQSGEFSFDTSLTKNILPLVLQPGMSHRFTLCYSPSNEGMDTAWMRWDTDIPSPYDSSIKPLSMLTGRGVIPGVFWDRLKQEFEADSLKDVIKRLYLINATTLDAEIIGLAISGADASEFSITMTEFNMNPPTYRGTVIGPGDSMWVDVAFKIDMTKPVASRRTALLQTAATLDSMNLKTVVLEAGFNMSEVENPKVTSRVRMYPNPAKGYVNIDIEAEEVANVSVYIYDVLGREVASKSFGVQSVGWVSLSLDLPRLAPGAYIAVTRTGGEVTTHRIVIE